MLKKISGNTPPAWLRIGDAQFPEPFPASLEYSPPARGTWNIVHTGMLVPQSHQIYICAIGCIRGVILTAAEMGAMDRFSTVIIEEKNILKGDIEALMLDGIADILQRLPELPPAVLVFTSCIHHFLGCNMPFVYRKLRERFPQTAFAECTMDPSGEKAASPQSSPAARASTICCSLLRRKSMQSTCWAMICPRWKTANCSSC